MKNVNAFVEKTYPFNFVKLKQKKSNVKNPTWHKTLLIKTKDIKRTEGDPGGGGLEVDPEGHPAQHGYEGAWYVSLQQEETQVTLE